MADQMLVILFYRFEGLYGLNQQLGKKKYTLYLDDHFSSVQALTKLA